MSSQSPAAPAAATASAGRQAASDVGAGWTVEEVTRKGGKTAGTKDKYWYSPAGKKFRSKAEIGRFKDALATLAGTDEEGDEDKAWKLFKGSGGGGSAKKQTNKDKSASSTKASSAKKKKATTGTDSSSKKKAASSASAKKKKAAKDGQASISEAFAAAAAASKQKKKRPAAESDGDDGEEKKEDEDMVMAASSSTAAKAAGSPKKKGKKMVARKSQKAGKPAAAEKANDSDEEMADAESDGEKGTKNTASRAAAAKKAGAPKGGGGGKKRKKGASDDDESVSEQKVETPKAAKTKGRTAAGKKKPKKSKVVKNLNEMEYDDMDVDNEEEEPTPPPTATSRSGRVRKKVNYAADYSDGDLMASSEEEKFDSSDDDFEKKPRARGGKKKAAGGKKKRAPPPSSDEESEVSSIASEESEEISDDAFGEDDDDDMDLEEEEEPKKKRGGGGKKKAAAAKKSKPAAKAKGDSGKKVGMAESFKPINAPPYFRAAQDAIAKEHECLDPCGTEATDDIIDGLVGNQVDKIGALLSRALKNKRCDLGSANCPLNLGTACSGTDAPALALTLVQEQMKLRNLIPDSGSSNDRKVGPAGSDGHLLNVDHKFSCEVEPFKQAYLGRNFDSTLYPDIGKLCDDPPLDVYGRPEEIPPFNLFVAGTSCKNFSMLRHKTRIDIEAKGCSGETFLAAVELLFKKKPKYCIFENVTGAPWEKMREYITGRIKLSNCGSDKNIGDVKAAEKAMEITFVLGEDGEIMVDQVPGVYGVRCDSIVEGFIKGGTRSIRPVEFPTSSKCQKERKCNLTELMKHNDISKADDTLAFETGVTYCAHYMKVDTKDYGLPQTRNRTYMFVWQPDNQDVEDDLGEYWEAIVSFLQSPVRHSLEAFILQPDHDIIRVFREALNGPAGRTSKRAAFLEPDFWASTSANLKYSTITRERSGIDQMARTVTSWGPYGEKQCPPHYWMEYLNVSSQRQLDVIEIMHASAARDAELHDSSFSSFFWNLSQNAGKEKHRGAKSGIAGCITPGGDVFLPHMGRPILGSEKLLLQGIPYFRLLLNNETEVQLGDLAGNAMSLTVVCATMLGALTCKQLRTECLEGGNVDPLKLLKKTASLPTKALQERLDADIRINIAGTRREPSLPCISSVLKQLAPLAGEAVEASILCTCESSGRNSSTCEFVQCRRCGVSCCRDCLHSTAGYQLKSHDTKSITVGDRTQGAFQTKLQDIVPTSFIFDEDGIKELSSDHRAKDLDKFVFNLHNIQRGRRTWRIVYYAKADAGTGEPIAQFVLSVGEVAAKGADDGIQLGVNGELTSFLPAKLPPLVYGPLSPCAKVRVLMGSEDAKMVWSQKVKTETTDLIVEGTGESPSFRAETGINDDAPDALVETSKTKYYQKIVANAKQRGEERRWFYPDNWKVWPKKIKISGGSSDASTVHGIYIRSDCRQTTNQSALWVREADGSTPTLYLLMQPFVSRNGSDFATISSSISHNDPSAILATFPFKWQPCDALKQKYHEVKGVKLSKWAPLALKCSVPKSNVEVNTPANDLQTLVEVSGLTELDVSMLGRNDTVVSKCADVVSLNVTRGQQAQQTVRVFNSICITPILQHAARNNLHYDLGPNAAWLDVVPSKKDTLLGCDETIVPTRPAEVWSYDAEREEWIRSFGPGESREYYSALKNSPSTFEMLLNIKGRKLTIKCDPRVAAHRAAFNLIEGRADNRSDLSSEVSVQYRLSDAARQTDPVLDPFHVSNCESLEPTSVSLEEPYELYDRQKKVVTKMAQIEDGKTNFEEIEMFDEPMPGSSGWSLVAKATRTKGIRGGVIADAIGAGKTVISIALILRKIEESRAARKLPMQSSATLVPMPPGLLDQWKGEIERFAPHLTTICVYDLGALKRLTVKEICHADVVLVPIDILQSNATYLQHILKMAGDKSTTAPKLPKSAGHREVSGATGVWIPGSSQDPYAGGDGDQTNRNESAHYTYVYNTAIQKLRKRTFKPNDKGVPLEYFEWHRIIVDEIHESLCTTKGEMKAAKEAAEGDNSGFFAEKNRRAGRELLGITEKNTKNRPLRFRSAMFGLTGTPLLDNCDRVIELANLMGGSYIIGLSSHWRKLERESMRDIFLHNYLEPRQSREVRRNVYSFCQKYLDTACCRNKTGEEMAGIKLVAHKHVVRMNDEEKKSYLGSMSGIPVAERSLAMKPEEFDAEAGHDISKFLRQNAKLACRGKALVDICKNVLGQEGNEHTKIVVFADGRIGAQLAAREYLCAEPGLGCTWLDSSDSVAEKNQKIAWYQTADVTAEDRARPRVLLLNFEHAAGLNLQTECNHLILFSPLYVGQGGTTGDAVTDASTELQAIGRVHRPGQPKTQVNVFRIEVRGPDDEECLDGQLIRRNTDEETVSMATNAAD